jgi:YggT family protein
MTLKINRIIKNKDFIFTRLKFYFKTYINIVTNIITTMNALFILIDQIISIYLYTLIAYVIITLLVQFEIVNRYNRIIDLILRGLIALHEPLLIKIRKYIPYIGGMDFSPVIVILLLSFIRNLLIDYRLSL